jgi:uncharacterized membrane protein YdjX (TVP38/TMEM64 family)
VSTRLALLVRLGLLLLFLVVLFVGSRIAGVDVSADSLRDWGEDLGTAGWIAFVPAAILLNCAFLLPVPIMCGAAGLLFGIPIGTALATLATAGAAGLQNAIGRRFGTAGAAERLLGRRGKAIDDLLDRRGFAAVLYVRLTPFAPFTALNYATGVTRLRPLAIGAGTGIAMAPRIYGYTALGGNLDDLGSTQSIVAFVLIATTAALGVALIVRAGIQQRRGGGPRPAEGAT